MPVVCYCASALPPSALTIRRIGRANPPIRCPAQPAAEMRHPPSSSRSHIRRPAGRYGGAGGSKLKERHASSPANNRRQFMLKLIYCERKRKRRRRCPLDEARRRSKRRSKWGSSTWHIRE
ncbi:hypothetical protein SORBI_3005G182600 [Sorghum bicolor]|uniref:Uncharacterized protein n=1 Tax=Sorghum bicolor TaxID=4558 RepID=C5Y5Z4_SORBI|nr:hypothetical protein SORBI_3005G182600 [Sorghum bicolor]